MTKHSQEWGGLLPEDVTVIAGKYSIDRVLKVGRLCVVIAVQQTDPDRPAILKVLRPELVNDEDNVTRFIRVNRQVAEIASEHVEQVFEVERLRDGGPPMAAMEWLTGGTFRDLLILHGPPRLAIALDYLIQTCEGLAAAHRQGVMHGDLRPAKLFRTHGEDGGAHVKIVDFGIAQALRRDAEQLASGAGTTAHRWPEYRAPEQIAGVSSIEPPTDVWAVGLTTYLLITGRHPFGEASSPETFAQAVAQGPPPILERVDEATAELDELLRHCLAPDPAERPQDLTSVAQRFSALAEHTRRPTEPPPPRPSAPKARGADSGAAGLSADTERRRFLGPAMGNRAIRGGSYSYAGRGVVTEETPFNRPRRRARRRDDGPRDRPSDRGSTADDRARSPGSSAAQRALEPTAPPGTTAGRRRDPRVDSDPPAPRTEELKPLPPRSDRVAQNAAPGQGVPADFRVTDPSPDREVAFASPTPELDPDATPPSPATAATPSSIAHQDEEIHIEWSDPAPAAPSREEIPLADRVTAPPAQARPRLMPEEQASARADRSAELEPEVEGAEPVPDRPAELELEVDFGDPASFRETDPATSVEQAAPAAEFDLELDLPDGAKSTPQATTAQAAADGPASASTAERFGAFVLERPLGVGSWSEAFQARPLEGRDPAERLVLKRSARGDVQLAALQHAVRQWSACGHPALVQVYDVDTVEGAPYLTTELVDGVDARHLIDWAAASERAVPYGVATLIVYRVAEALAALHGQEALTDPAAGLVHGDVRPSKVYLSTNGQVRLGLGGFSSRQARGGLARRADKFDFQAPEELTSEPVDQQSDVFALGVMLGELLIGRPIFPGAGLDVLFAIQEGDFKPLVDQAPMLPPGLFDVCAQALARFRSDRFASAHDFAEAVGPFERANTDAEQQLGDCVHRAQNHRRRSLAVAERSAPLSLQAQAQEARRLIDVQKKSPTIRVRRIHSGLIGQLSLAQLLEAIATGGIGPDDEVTWDRSSFQPISDVPVLRRHLLASAQGLEGSVSDTNTPDHVYALRETPMLAVLAQMRQCYATGLLLAESLDEASPQRREIYLRDGRLHCVMSSDPRDLLGTYLEQQGLITAEQKAQALTALPSFDGNMGNALIGLRTGKALDIYRAIRRQAVDRVASAFGWPDGRVQVYLSYLPSQVPFPLGLDLTCPMVEGVGVASGGDASGWLPPRSSQLSPGPKLPPTEGAEVDGVPVELRALGPIAGARPTLAAAISTLQDQTGADELRASAALITALALGWISANDNVR